MKDGRSVYLNTENLEPWMNRERWNLRRLALRMRIHPATLGRYSRKEVPTPYPVIMALSLLSGIQEVDLAKVQAA